MKKLIILLGFIFETFTLNAQTVVSSCEADDSVRYKYSIDANRLTLLRFYESNILYKDSIHIPKSYSDTVLNALTAVYNAYLLPARDTVTDILDIHSYEDFMLNSFNLSADSSLVWMDSLRLGNIPTGEAAIDDLIATYHLNLSLYSTNSNLFSFHTAYFESDSSYNIPQISPLFASIPGVQSFIPNAYIGASEFPDGDNITCTIFTDRVELIYSRAWNDCPSGCTARRFWKFNVYNNCSVEFIESYGTPLTVGMQEILESKIEVYPNPVNDKLFIKHKQTSNNAVAIIKIYNSLGAQVLNYPTSLPASIDISNFPLGFYFLEVENTRVKLIKN